MLDSLAKYVNGGDSKFRTGKILVLTILHAPIDFEGVMM